MSNPSTIRLWFMWMLVALVLPACSGDDPVKITKTIPAEVGCVCRFNPIDILKLTGSEYKDGKLTLSDALKSSGYSVGNSEKAKEQFEDVLGSIYGDEVYWVMMEKGSGYLTFNLSDWDKFEGTLDEMNSFDVDGFDDGYMDSESSFALLRRGAQVWFAQGIFDIKDFASTIEKQQRLAEKKSIADIPVLDKAFSDQGKLLSVVVNRGAVSERLNVARDNKGGWMLIDGECNSEGKLVFDVAWLDSNGQSENILDGVNAIDPEFLKYSPEGAQMQCAFGVKANADWDFVAKALVKVCDGVEGAGMAMSLLKPYLEAIDGTVSVSIKYPSSLAEIYAVSNGDMSSIKFVAMAKMKPEMIEGAKSVIGKILVKGDIANPQASIAGPFLVYTVKESDKEIYFGNVDGYLTISNYPITCNIDSEIYASKSKSFEGQKAAIEIDIPSLGRYGMPISYGVDGLLQMGESSGVITIEALGKGGTTQPITDLIQELLELM